MLSERVACLTPTAVNAILAEVRQLQAQGRDLISLMRGEPDLPTPRHIVEAAAEALRRGRTGYPDNRGEARLREAVAAKLSRDNGLTFDPASELLITTGATEGIAVALAALLNPGDEVLLPDPVYDAYLSPIRLMGGVPRPVTARVESGRYQLDLDALDAACGDRTRALLLNTPWNPVGTVFREQELHRIAGIAERHNLVLLSDEIYEEITYAPHKHISPLAASSALRGRAVLVNSLSKTYSMPGWRVGYCAGPKALIHAMLLVLQQSSRGPATFVQDAAATALGGSQECVAEMRQEYARRRGQVIETLDGVAGVRVLPPEGGFFAMVDVTALGLPSNELRRRLLHDNGVVVVHGAAYGPAGEGMLRVSFASGGETLARGLDRLRTALETMG
ncbi:MAG: pyridoxal phosphate-dependent aminotransferase [Bryobacteraceae bacterium]